eukprot:CAMPEP_0197293802 /NCGR_PEP_ID=MMETSP0890-20130614/29972_1 /TAXON_ID=44058 ORGANISM="Aureoumbra lagunensis, Strain CCMP1510" /NCGR_SAMPLE_ID=MMETSP0890 /ASSEMBLY_ACC=CAM_ASM_000533 /LENGTH=118 /DNA_ID=CAMNT_0042768823 /DNA_START=135 /DNA_END=488 /DNA_ORIENTATION=-
MNSPSLVALDALSFEEATDTSLNQSRIDAIVSTASASGLFQRPLRVRRDDLEVLDGKHHYAAAKALGLLAVPVSFFDDDGSHLRHTEEANHSTTFFPDSSVWRNLALPLKPCAIPLEK